MNRYTESGFSLANLWAVFTDFYHGQYAPLNELLYIILYAIFGYNPLFFHLASLLLHAANVLLVYACVVQLLSLRPQKVDGAGVAFVAALIFAVHPLNVESVAWMSASKVLVYAFYYLLATYSFILYLKHKRIKYYIFTILLFVCSFWGKEQAVTFPLWMLLIFWYAGYSFKSKKLWLETTPFLLLSLIFGIVTMMSQAATGAGVLSDEPAYPLWQRLVYACYSLTEYLLKTLIPVKLSYLYPFPNIVGEPLPSWLLIYPMLVVIAVTAFWKQLSTHKVLAFSLLFFLIHIAVALHIIPLSRFAIVADRYAYVSSMGIAFAVSYGFILLFMKYGKRGKIIAGIVLGCYVLYLGIYAGVRSRVWYDTDSLKKEIREILKQRKDSGVEGKLYKMENKKK